MERNEKDSTLGGQRQSLELLQPLALIPSIPLVRARMRKIDDREGRFTTVKVGAGMAADGEDENSDLKMNPNSVLKMKANVQSNVLSLYFLVKKGV